ncbi:DNA/RNA non-specific endonuclease [Klebsiella grimontii]|uniref:DNA/RNA non-specific endonuclease n=1 Tax=Klebsiella grimontii TaxID=2058152 RepID=UPI003BF87C50
MHRFHLLCDVINNMKLFRIFSVLPSLFFAAACAAGLSHVDNCEVGCPSGGSDQTLVREAYTLNNNSHRKFANWVAYKITKASLASGRSRSWKRDPDLPATDTLAPAAYKGASAALAVDRGHQATPKSASFYDYQVTVEQIERRTHPALSFWSALPAGIARRLKSRKGTLAKEMGCP